ncbi:MAG: flavin reductase family protein [Erythrobacter sp.]|uniref:flavin reductase family protein n=1 Tax=Erythrobacter sp. TaxID=1042 RepID=UPI00263377F2|nr:flavin reductase family protein [Erythrobacter sp.]MDJ0979120.1 flavin reductase family protein [Erythrobacter sp.]
MHDVRPPDPIDTKAFRRLMGQFATGVCVVSAAEADGALAGITVNSFVSVSLDPLLVSWSLHNTSSQFDLWTKTPDYTVSILAHEQAELAGRYAKRGGHETKAEDFDRSVRGLPVIAGALGYLECRHWSLYRAGDHTMVFGEVIGIQQAARGDPLVFFGGDFRRIAD